MGNEAQAATAAARAIELSRGLERDEQLEIEAYSRDLHHEYDRAIELYQSLLSFYPDRADWLLRLAEVQARAHRGRDCHATLESLSRLPMRDRDDPAVAALDARCFEHLGDFRRMRVAAERARQEAGRRGARLLAARAEQIEGRALRWLDQYDEALRLTFAARDHFAQLGADGFEAMAIVNTGDIYNRSGQYAEARKQYETAVARARALGDPGIEVSALDGLTYRATPEQAQALYREILSLAERKNDQRGRVYPLTRLAAFELLGGHISQGLAHEMEAVRLAGQVGAQQLEGEGLCILCSALQRSGDATGALAACAEATARFKLGGGRAEAISVALKSVPALIDRGLHADAEATARQATSEAHTLGVPILEASGHAAVATVLLAEGRRRDAEAAIAAAMALPKPSDPDLAFTIEIPAARVRGTTDAAAGARMAAAVASQARATGWRYFEREALLLQYQLEQSAGHGARAATALTTLEREARRDGDLYIARQAWRARRH
jgi:tetratricopeptide (TPR) repeat protein